MQVFPVEELVELPVGFPVEEVVADSLQSHLSLKMIMTLKVQMQSLKKWKKS